nr:protein TBATA isoform X2 [Ictidomys tridecemlineatus]
MGQETQGPRHQRPPGRAQGHPDLLNISRVHLHAPRGTFFGQGHLEKEMQTTISPKAELNLEKKPRHWPQSLGDSGPQKESVVPGIVDLELTREKMRSPKATPSGTYRFGRLSHHSFFSRHHPHPHHVTHIPDFTGRPVCIVRNKLSASPLPRSSILSQCLKVIPSISVPIGDPQSNRNPQLSYEAWKKELKELTSRVVMFTKETEQNNKEKEEPSREQGARYSAETGRLIPASAQALSRHGSQQGQRSHLPSRDRGVQTSVLQNQELLGGPTAPGVRFSGPVGRGHRAGLQGLHLPPWAQTPVCHSHFRRKPLGRGSTWVSSEAEVELLLMLPGWRAQGKKGPEVAKMPEAEDAGMSPGCPLTGRKESHAEQLAEPACPDPQAAHRQLPTTLISPSDPGAPLSDPSDGFAECRPVLAAVCHPHGEGPCSGAPAEGGVSASPSALSLPSSRKTLEPASANSRSTSREAALTLQSTSEGNENITGTENRKPRSRGKSPSPPGVLVRGHREGAPAEGRAQRGLQRSQKTLSFRFKCSPPGSEPAPQQQPRLSYHKQSTQ